MTSPPPTRPLPRKPTSHDIAELVGVSQPTVSKALRGDRSIKQETRDRIREAARSIGYRVNRNASRLRTQRTNAIALVVLARHTRGRVDVSPFHLALLGHIATAASEAGHELIVSFQSDEGELFGHYEDAGLADGVIVIGSSEQQAAWSYFRQLKADGVAMVSWSFDLDSGDGPHDALVTADNRAGGALVAQHFRACGRRHPVFIGGGDDAPAQFRDRYAGLAEEWGKRDGSDVPNIALSPLPGREARLGEPQASVVAAEKSCPTASLSREAQGEAATRALIAGATPCDAIFAANDLIAIGALAALAEAGKRVPDDVAVIGFDNSDPARYCRPALTTVEQDLPAAGRLLVTRLLAGRTADAAEPTLVPVRLVLRESGGRDNP